MDIITSSGIIQTPHFVGLRGSGSGYAIVGDRVLEVVQRDDGWRAVRRVAPDTVPMAGRDALRGSSDAARHAWGACEDAWDVEHRDHVAVILTFGPVWTDESGIPARDYYRDPATAIRRAQGMTASTIRVALVPRSEALDADISTASRIIWSR